MHNARRRSDPSAAPSCIHVAIGMMVLIGFLTFVVDYGVMWVGRGQAQNAADAGALAGAVSMAFDANGWTDRTETGPARTSARQMAVSNCGHRTGPGRRHGLRCVFHRPACRHVPGRCQRHHTMHSSGRLSKPGTQ